MKRGDIVAGVNHQTGTEEEGGEELRVEVGGLEGGGWGVQGVGCGVWSVGYRVWGVGCRVQGGEAPQEVVYCLISLPLCASTWGFRFRDRVASSLPSKSRLPTGPGLRNSNSPTVPEVTLRLFNKTLLLFKLSGRIFGESHDCRRNAPDCVQVKAQN